MKLRLEHRRLIPRTLYIFFLTGLIAAEWPLNMLALELFGRGGTETGIMAGGLGLGLVGLAHAEGVLVARLGTVRNRVRAVVEIALACLIGVVLVRGVASIGEIRSQYLVGVQHELGLGIRLTPKLLHGVAVVQMLVVIAAATASFFHANEAADEIERAVRSHRKALRRRRLVETFERRAERSLAGKQSRRDMIRSRYRERALRATAWFELLRFERRSANIRAHVAGPDPAFLSAELPAIEPGDWTNDSLALYSSLDADETEPPRSRTARLLAHVGHTPKMKAARPR